MYTGKNNLDAMEHAKNYNKNIVNILLRNLPNTGNIIDFGAGIGTFAKALESCSVKVICIETDKEQFLNLIKSDFKTLSSIDEVKDNSIESLFSINVLEHIDDDYSILRTMHSKLKIGGKIIIYVPAMMVLYTSMDSKVGHFRRYGKKQLFNLIQKSGFDVSEINYVDCLGVLITLIFKLIGNKDGNISQNQVILYDKFIFPLSKILDLVLRKYVGKNLYIVATKI